MPKRRVQVTLSEYDYDAVRRAAERDGTSLASVVREAVQEYRVDPDHKKRQLAALDAAEALPESELSPMPEDRETWKREYGESKGGRDCGMSREEFERIAGPPDEDPVKAPASGERE